MPMRETGFKDEIHYAELPELNTILDGNATRAAGQLLEELDAVTQGIAEYQAREKEIKEALDIVQIDAGVKGMKYGTLCFVARIIDGRETLDRGLLIENGVEPHIIAKSLKRGEAYVQRTFKNIAKGKRK